MSDFGQLMQVAVAIKKAITIAVCAVVFGGAGWAIGHFLF